MPTNTITIVVSHPSQDVTKLISEIHPGKEQYTLVHWDLEMASFLKTKCLLWSKQRSTQDKILVVNYADRISVPMMSLISGIIDQDFSRSLVLIVQNIHRVPYSLLRKANIVHNKEKPIYQKGWKKMTPHLYDHLGWESLLLD